MGWLVIVVWECELKTKELREATLQDLCKRLSELRNGTYSHPHYPMGGEDSLDFLIATEPEI